MIDTHCHLDSYSEDKIESVIKKAFEEGITTLITVGCDILRSKRCIEIAKMHPSIYATCGIHPCDWESVTDESLEELENIIQTNNEIVVGIGESGLDYYQIERIPGWKEQEARIKIQQKKSLEFQGYLSKKYNKPLIIHNRDSSHDVLEFLTTKQYSKVVLHCFSEHEDFLEKVLENDTVFFSFAGNITYNSMKHIENCIKIIPSDRYMIETDSPFLVPRGTETKQNEPQYISKVVEKIAEILKKEKGEIILETTKTAKMFWNLN